MSCEDVMPPLFAMAVRYLAGDYVTTPYGPGKVISCSDRNMHVEVSLAGGVVLYARKGCLFPQLRMLQCGEIPRHTNVIILAALKQRKGVVLDYNVSLQKYQVQLENGESDNDDDQEEIRGFQHTILLPTEKLRLAEKTRVRTSFGLGTITVYQNLNDSYAVQLDSGNVGYFQAENVSCVDLRLLAKIPKPLSAHRIYEDFQGRISRDDAQMLSFKANEMYGKVQSFCEQHAEAISFVSTNAAYGDQYNKAMAALLDPAFADATKRLKNASTKELKRLTEVASSVKLMLESDLLGGNDSASFFAKAANVLSQLKTSEEFKGFQSRLRENVSVELTVARERLLSQGNKSSSMLPSQEDDKIILSQVLQILEGKLDAKRQRFTALKASLDCQTLQSEALAKLQEHESDLMKARETISHLEHIASKTFGVNSVLDLHPSALTQKAEEVLPRMSSKIETLVHASEKYWLQMQQTTHGQTLMKKAKALIQSIENPDEFCDNVTKVIAEVKLDRLAEWGNTMSKNRGKRQEFVDRMKDHCLDFLTSVLPTLKIDTISGVEDDITYSISKLDLSNFRLKKERVKVCMGTVVDEELFKVRATHLTALLKGFDWTFEQNYFPYLHGGGVADAVLNGGVISMGFKAEKKVANQRTGEFKPILVLDSIAIEIRKELKLTVQGSWFSAVYNVLTSLFAELIREYLAKTMETKLLKHMIKLLGTLNKQMDEYWSLIFQLLDIRLEDLPTASPWRGAKEVECQPQELECTFVDKNILPFRFSKGVLNKYIFVSRIDALATNTQEQDDNRNTLLTNDLKRISVGSSVLAINGLCCSKLTVEELKSLLETLPLPFTMRFSLLPEDLARNRRQQIRPQPELTTFTFRQNGPFGLRLRARPLATCGVIVVGFTSLKDGKKCPAEESGKVRIGQLLIKVNKEDMRFKTLSEVLSVLRDLISRPVTMQFASSPDAIIKLRDWPPLIEMEDESSLECDEDDPPSTGRNYVVLSAFTRVPSFAQKSRTVKKGDVLIQVNNILLTGPGYTGFVDIMETLRSIVNKKEPVRAVFVGREDYVAIRKRLLQQRLSVSGSGRHSVTNNDKICEKTPKSHDKNDDAKDSDDAVSCDDSVDVLLTIPTREIIFPKPPLGILFGNWKDEAIYIREFISSPGPAEKTGLLRLGHAILQVCGQSVPKEATPEIIEEMIMDVMLKSKAGDKQCIDQNITATDLENEAKMKYTLTVRDLELEQVLMRCAN
ncbi:PDZ domain [Plasmopara halstedii]|uniref:PDZ domain n=1 Tax=Plasmopara halstedii TaxID=4781 RepID=A0A0P1AIZ2_PLAHL|nr:PDZ domain [Plasmopara halstedii]CEG41190.1 PDZ domain [Plasmopara halstedii]|eukprot:XP_024577559.1 PDZ domain [Plasmopara halstedii]